MYMRDTNPRTDTPPSPLLPSLLSLPLLSIGPQPDKPSTKKTGKGPWPSEDLHPAPSMSIAGCISLGPCTPNVLPCTAMYTPRTRLLFTMRALSICLLTASIPLCKWAPAWGSWCQLLSCLPPFPCHATQLIYPSSSSRLFSFPTRLLLIVPLLVASSLLVCVVARVVKTLPTRPNTQPTC